MTKLERLSRHSDALIAMAVTVASFLLYLRTLAPDVVDADGGEFQLAAWNFAFVHPTGYPLYLILGGIFQHLVPISNPAYRLNLFTAITGAFAVGMLYLVVKEIARHRGAALVATACFAVTRVFWYDATAAETYDLNAFFVALLAYLALRWQANPSPGVLVAFFFTFGLALTHHRTIALWAPAFVLFAIIESRLSPSRFPFHEFRSRLFTWILAFTIPLLLYLYIPLRAPTAPYASLQIEPGRTLLLYENSVSGFVNYIIGRSFAYELGWDGESVLRLASVPNLLLNEFGLMGVVIGAIGICALLWRREWGRLVLLFTGFVLTVLFASLYHIGDIFHYYIPAYLVWAMLIGVGVSAILGAVDRSQAPIAKPLVSLACLVLIVLLLPVFLTLTHIGAADRSGETGPREQWTRILSYAVPKGAILVSNDRDEMMPLWYMQYVENTRRDLLALFPLITPEQANIVRLTDDLIGHTSRPIFFIKSMPGIEIKFRVDSSTPLSRVIGQWQGRVPENASAAVLAGRVRILGYDRALESSELRLAIYWVPLGKLDENYTTFVHLLDARGEKVAQSSDHRVGGEFYPTSMWVMGEMLRDEHVITLPPDLASGSYTLVAGMYLQPGLQPIGTPVAFGSVELR